MTKYGCHNTPRAAGYWVRVGRVEPVSIVTHRETAPIEEQQLAWHEDRSSRECQHRLAVPGDPRCEGCRK